MPDPISISLSPEAQSLLKRLGATEQMLVNMAATLDEENLYTVSRIQQEYMSFPKDGPTSPIGLRVQSNRLRQSVFDSAAVVQGSQVVSSIGSNVKYAAIHEFGGRTRPHVIRAKKAKALGFMIGDRMVYRKSVNHPGSNMPARAPFQRGIRDRMNDYGQALSAAVLKSWEGAA